MRLLGIFRFEFGYQVRRVSTWFYFAVLIFLAFVLTTAEINTRTGDTAGVETPVPMDDWVEIGVFAPAEESDGLGEPLYLQMHRIRSSEQTITVTVSREPARTGIDPYHLIDFALNDNTKDVEFER